MAPGSRPTIIDVSHAAGVSPSTVSLVLRGSSTISAPTVARVKQAIADLGYVYNRRAASLRASRSRIFGVVVHDLTNSVFSQIATGIDGVLQDAGFVQFISSSGDTLSRQSRVISSMREYGIAGLIISPASGTRPRDLAAQESLDIPVVQVGRKVGTRVASVTSDNSAGTLASVDYLRSLGHMDIAFIGGDPKTETFTSRLAGFTQALEKAQVPEADRLVVPAQPSRAGGFAAMSEILHGTGRRRITAVIAFNDEVAFGAYQAIRAAGLIPGADVDVVGFDDVPEAATAYPPLTTVSVNPALLGQTAAHLLLSLLGSDRGSEADADQPHIVLPVNLTVRASTHALSQRG
jgi:LacI family transcriptional regulator